jgi:eukaryotic-like serine/threonine-protein kinase
MSATAPPKLPRGAPLRAGRTVDVGAVLDGKYRIDSILGRGGMAIVVGATHETLGHRVAIKLLLPDAGSSPAHAQRILREARAAAGLTSENATRVLDIGALDSGEPYIVMELLTGMDFGRLLQERGPLPLRDVARYLVQACEAVAEAHAKGIVHRDLKPSNLFLTTRPDGSPLVKLMDFGISKLVSEGPDESLTRTQDSLGTPHYMSPEQLLTSRGVDARTDVWALGVILYRLLTGEYPFTGETTPAVHIAVASADAPKLRAKRPDAPVEIEELVAQCLVKSRTARLQTVNAFAAALLPFADDETRKRYAHVAEVKEESFDVPIDTGASAALGAPLPLAAADAETRSAWGTDGSGSAARARVRRGAIALGAFALVLAALGSIQLARRVSAGPVAAPLVSAATAAPQEPAPPRTEDMLPTASPPSPSVASASAPADPSSLSVASAIASPPRRRPKSPAASVTPAPADSSRPPDPYGQRR